MLYEGDKKNKVVYIKFYENMYDLVNSYENNIINKIKFIYMKLLKRVNLIKEGKKYILVLPVNNNSKKCKIENAINKANKIIEKYEIQNVVLSKEILTSNLIKSGRILTGKMLMKNMVVNIIEKILQLQNGQLEQANIHILINEYNHESMQNIKFLIQKVKCVNIVTENIKLYKKFQEQLYDEQGIVCTVSNNKRKALKKAELIVNYDYSCENLRKYSINRKAKIVNISNNVMELKNVFNGIIITSIEIQVKEDCMEFFKINNLINKFNILELYESIVYNNANIKVTKKMIDDELKIVNFIGNRGIINESEFANTNM